jgi:two-component system nitrate/nitrite response regulator NarL
MKQANKIRILLVDDHPLVRSGIKSELNDFDFIEVCGEASTGKEGVSKADLLKPDVILLDINMPDINGIEAMKLIKNKTPNTKIIALTMHDSKHYILEMMRLGALGYVLKDSDPGEVVKAIQRVYEGKTYFSSNISAKVMDFYSSEIRKIKKPYIINKLTGRESEVLTYIVKGNSNKQIASRLNISVRTVETHRDRIMHKLNIHSVAGLTKYAISEGIIDV